MIIFQYQVGFAFRFRFFVHDCMYHLNIKRPTPIIVSLTSIYIHRSLLHSNSYTVTPTRFANNSINNTTPYNISSVHE